MPQRPRRFGRYLLFEPFARGGMASVCFGRVVGPVGFSRVVAIKRHHSHLLKEPDFVSMMIDEARLAGRVRHPSVVPVLDLVQLERELLLVMEYVDGLSLAKIWRQALEAREPIPMRIAVTVVGAVLQGLHAAHEMRDDRGELAGLVHRDVSPQNVLVGRDGLARVTDFGIALARERLQFTRTEEIKGKLEYMAPEQLRRDRVDRRADVYAASLVLWELLTRRRPFVADTDRTVMTRIVSGDIPSVRAHSPEVPEALDALVMRGLAQHPTERFATALDMARELERVVGAASQLEVAQWIERVVGEELARRAARVAEIEAWREEPTELPVDETVVDAVDEASDVPVRASWPGSEVRVPSTRPLSDAADGIPSTRPMLTEPEPADSVSHTDRRLPPTRPMIEVTHGTATLTATTAVNVAAGDEARGEAHHPEVGGEREPGPITDTRVATVRSMRRAVATRERLVWLLPLGAFLLGAVLLGAVALTRLAPTDSRDSPSPPPSEVSSVPALAAAPSRSPAPAVASSVGSPLAPPAGAEPSAVASSARVAAPVRPHPSSKPAWTTGVAKPQPKAAGAACNPPYRVDPQGVRVPKPECFGR